jgi:hypothetical protein
MKRKEDKPLTKHTLNLYEGQVEKLQTLHPRLGSAFVIRKLIDKHIVEAETLAAEAVPEPRVDMKVEEIL